MDKDHRHCTPIRRLSQLQDKEYLPLRVIQISRGSSMTQSDNLPEPVEDTHLTP
jgi:hypothetical protein